MRIALGADHAGVDLKDRLRGWLIAQGHDVEDLGTHGGASVDYPDYARPVAEAVAAGKPVFVDFTAAWCITCLVNERVALDTPASRRAFEAAGVVKLKGDWTNRDPEITAVLKDLGRAGVPLYLFWPPGAPQPRILPQVLTESLILSELASIPPAKR